MDINKAGRATSINEKAPVDCDSEFKRFMEVMDILGEKLGPLLFQFGYFNRKTFLGVNDFFARLRPFLKKLPKVLWCFFVICIYCGCLALYEAMPLIKTSAAATMSSFIRVR
jgi:uncharacterized protein YecE (DUF72 family)